jgi:cytidylate kinase
MRSWALRIESQQRLAEQDANKPRPQLVCPYIAISREAGVDATAIAQTVAAQCSWKVFDRELLDYMVEHYHWSRVALDYVDERTVSWFHETFGKWLDAQLVSQAEFVHRLGKIILLAAQHESLVIVGRGAQFILPRQLGSAVRIVAPRKYRIACIMSRRECTRSEAEKFIDDTDRGRADFVQRYFHRDVADPHLYDLVINLEYMTREAAASIIARDCKARFCEQK